MNWKSFCLSLLKMAYQYFGKKIRVCLCVVCIVCVWCVCMGFCVVCVHVSVCCGCAHTHLEARDHHLVSSPISLPLIYLRQSLSLVWGSLILLDWLARWLHPSPLLQCWDYWYTAPAFWRGFWGYKLRPSCLHAEYFTDWTISSSPFEKFELYFILWCLVSRFPITYKFHYKFLEDRFIYVFRSSSQNFCIVLIFSASGNQTIGIPVKKHPCSENHLYFIFFKKVFVLNKLYIHHIKGILQALPFMESWFKSRHGMIKLSFLYLYDL